MRAASGSQAAVFKRIRAGGCKTPGSLRNQLDYVNDKANWVYATQSITLGESAVLSAEEKAEIVAAWSGGWHGTTKLGHTSHMLLSFPMVVGTEAVRAIAVKWAERLFESGHYGDTWDYVLAVHDDRAHGHAHVVLNNRGRDHGTWFSCAREGVMNPQHMRELQAEIAAEHGVALEATSRLERGLVTEPAGIEEVYAAQAEGRARREPEMGVVESMEARAAIAWFAGEQQALADMLERAEHATLARATRAMSDSIASGQPWEASMAGTVMGTVALDEIRTIGDAIAYAERRWEMIDAQAAGLEPAMRARFEIAAVDVRADLTALMPDAELRAAWTSGLAETYPPGAELADASEALRREGLAGARPEAVEAALEEGRGLGLEIEEMAARLEAGGTRSLGLAQAWTDRDVAAILTRDGVDPQAASEAEREAATERLDVFQDRLRGAMVEAGAEARIEMPAEVVDLAEARAAREAGRATGIAEPDTTVAPAPAGPQPADLREREQAEQRAYLVAHPELLASPAEVYTLDADGFARLREDGQASRVLHELSEMGITGREPDAEARIAGALAERHPDMPSHVARDLAVTYAVTAELMAAQGERSLEAELNMRSEPQPGAEPFAAPTPDLDLQALATRLRREDLSDEEKASVARALETVLHRHLGMEGMRRLDEGEHEALVGVLPKLQDRMNITYERLDLKRELSRERGLDRDMDDDLGL